MAHKLPNDLLLDYQIEYQTSDITIDELCEKYGVVTKQLSGYTKWEKAEEPPEVIEPAEIIIAPEAKPQPRDLDIADGEEEMKEQIGEFKKLAMAHAVKFMKDDAEFAEVKEFKDMVAIVDSIEKSYKGAEASGNTINIAIQKLVQKFEDDC